MTDKKLLESSLNTIMMVSFAIPGAAPAGITAAVGSFLVQLFYPDAKPGDPPVTQPQLSKALDSVKTEIIDALWKQEATKTENNLLAFHQGLHDTWANIRQLKVDGPNGMVMATDSTIQGWVDAADKFFVIGPPTSGDTLCTLRGYRNTLTNDSLNDSSLTPLQVAEHRTAHTALYSLVASLILAYLKMATVWQWANILLSNQQYAAYKAAIDNWNAQDAAYQKAHPWNDLITSLKAAYPKLDYDHYVPKDWNAWIKDTGCPVPELFAEGQAIKDYCVLVPPDQPGDDPQPGLYTELRNHWDDFDKQMASYDVALTPGQGITIAQMKSAMDLAAQRAVAWDKVCDQYAIGNVTEADILAFGHQVDLWKAVAADVNYTMYTVKAGDTLASIATAKYNDASLAPKIFDNNKDVLPDAQTPLKAGTLLKIFDKDALADLRATDPASVIP